MPTTLYISRMRFATAIGSDVGSFRPAANSTMTPTLDLLVLTFNCAKTVIDATVFAAHLRAALTPKAGGKLPDLVVL